LASEWFRVVIRHWSLVICHWALFVGDDSLFFALELKMTNDT